MAGQPDVADVHVNTLLSQISIAHMNDLASFAADKIFRPVGTDKQTDIYPVYDRGFFFADEGERMVRAPGANAATSGFKITTTNTFFNINYAIGMELPDELIANSDEVFNLHQDATVLVTHIQMIRRERGFAVDFMKTGVWGTDVTGTTNFVKWSDYAGSDPLSDIRTGIRTVQLNTGMAANTLVLGKRVWDRLADHPDLIDRLNGGQTPGGPAVAMPENLARILGLDEVIIMDSVYRSSVEGATTLTMAFTVSDDALLIYRPRTASKLMPSSGYTFFWKSLVNGSAVPHYIRSIREERPRKTIIEAHAYWDQVATETQAGYYFSDAVD